MRKIFYLMAMAIAAVAFTACSDDTTQEVSLVVGDDNAKEVTINRLGGILEIPITATGEWTASLPADCKWAKVVTKQRVGSGTIVLSTDYYNPRNTEDRRTELTVASGNTTKTIRIRQYLGLHDGENDAATVSDDAWGNTVLGVGVNIVNTGRGEEGMIKGNWVVSPENAQWIAQQNRRYNRVFVTSTSAEDIGEEGVAEELHSKQDSLGIHASVSVTYGLFTLKVEGDYSSNETEVKNKVSYSTEYQAPRATAWIGARDLASLATMTIDRNRYRNEDEYYDMLDMQEAALTIGFDGLRKDIMDAFDATYKEKMDKADSTWQIPNDIEVLLKDLDNDYGPVYISRVVMGGSTFLNIEYDSIYVTDTLRIDGSIKVDITNGLLNVKAGVEAGYGKSAKDIMENSKSTFTVRGGGTKERSAVVNSLKLKKSQVDGEVTSEIKLDSVRGALTAWSASIPKGAPTQSNKGLYASISYGYSPIWAFFGKYSAFVKEFFIREYKNKDTLVDLKTM